MKKILIESDDTHGTTKTTIDLTEYTEFVVKIITDEILKQLKDVVTEQAKKIAEERKK